MTEWRLTAAEFVHALEAAGVDRVPYPFRYRAEPADYEGRTARRRASASRVAALASDVSFVRALQALVDSDVRIEVAGFRGADGVRLLAGIDGAAGAVARQLSSAELRGDVIVTACSPRGLGAAIAAQLPECPPGARRPFRAPRGGSSDSSYSTSVLRSAGAAPTSDPVRAFVQVPCTASGEITIVVRADAERSGRDVVFWYDFEGDGRYVVQEKNDIVCAPATSAMIGSTVQRIVDATLDRGRDEHAPFQVLRPVR
ncbi:ESX secretion-associated protein EspG [Rhodococcus rhodnii]|uniref:ESX secretion-associated protein EspG n=1 Tax=Rhodococcus rhodnii LMG 5362 TaxID=1273125 RepID=R7WM81_9NOCA|nr:ESX secretion-associated protein EspG [Rhodococcus rhodnii]EOM76375.1 hypothetical protein Rrhod_2168 [Rhodococcus rhodnii LMG 5362]